MSDVTATQGKVWSRSVNHFSCVRKCEWIVASTFDPVDGCGRKDGFLGARERQLKKAVSFNHIKQEVIDRCIDKREWIKLSNFLRH